MLTEDLIRMSTPVIAEEALQAMFDDLADPSTIQRGRQHGFNQPAVQPHATDPPLEGTIDSSPLTVRDDTIDPSLLTVRKSPVLDDSDDSSVPFASSNTVYNWKDTISDASKTDKMLQRSDWDFLNWPMETGNGSNPSSSKAADSHTSTCTAPMADNSINSTASRKHSRDDSDATLSLHSQDESNRHVKTHDLAANSTTKPASMDESHSMMDISTPAQPLDNNIVNTRPPTRWNPALLLTKHGGTTSLRGPEAEDKHLSPELGIAVLNDDRVTVERLLIFGAKPMTVILNSSFAVDVAVKMNHVATVRAFLSNPQNFAELGLRCLLIAVVENLMDVVKALFELGIRQSLAADEEMKLIFWGFTCKHGTPDMLETMHQHGPEFSWKAYWHWCLFLTDETYKPRNAEKIMELRDAYMKVRSLAAAGYSHLTMPARVG